MAILHRFAPLSSRLLMRALSSLATSTGATHRTTRRGPPMTSVKLYDVVDFLDKDGESQSGIVISLAPEVEALSTTTAGSTLPEGFPADSAIISNRDAALVQDRRVYLLVYDITSVCFIRFCSAWFNKEQLWLG